VSMRDWARAAAPYALRIVGELDRYHGFGGAAAQPAVGATRALAASAPALALPAPGETAEKSLARD